MDYMLQALSLARLALGQVSPNPAVGAVIVKDDLVIGLGHTQPPGSAHAEIMALHQAGEKARGAVMYVTLEPCCIFGRTPPCTQAIIAAGISEVHFAMIDPNPLISGKGQAELEKAGIPTFYGEHSAEAAELNEAFFKYITRKVPFVTAKFAMSLDGKIATRGGDSQWISGEAARKQVQRLRYESDAVMVGANTVMLDDPHLTVRFGNKGGTTRKQPLRVIIDGRGRISPEAKIFSEPGKTLVVTGDRVSNEVKELLVRAGAEVLALPLNHEQVDLRQLMLVLGERQITSVLVEGGGTLLGALFDAGLVDKVYTFVSPVIIGGKEAVAAVGGLGKARMADCCRLKKVKTEIIDQDVLVSGYIEG
jgi:diaminohydroxyphosphoribosylaminopyrimidine deaminase / 5-amino-6-(5-phosphoribosylamino)uracil reductase